MVLLVADRISKSFGDIAVLDQVSLEIRAGDHMALVGPNGTGKTTLLRILTDQQNADSGSVQWPTGASVGYLQQHPEFAEGDTVWNVASAAVGDLAKLAHDAEDVAERLARASDPKEHDRLLEQFDRLQVKLQHSDGYYWEHRVERVLQGLGFSDQWYQRPAQQLSGGQQNRLMLVCLLLAEPDLMILDEPNNHLDIESTEWLESTLAQWPGAFLLVSHDRFFLDQVTHEVLELVDGKIDRFRGNYSAYVRQKSERLEVQRRTFQRQREEIEKLEEFIRKHHAGQKSTQAEDRRKKLERIEPVDRPREIVIPKFRFPPAARSGDIVLRCQGMKKAFDRILFERLSFQLQRGQRWAILGSNGSGKTTLLKCLLGEIQSDEGTVSLGTNVRIGYFDQLLAKLDRDAPALEVIRVPNRELVDKDRRDILAAFGLAGDVVTKPLRMLSGGERNRTMLAWLSALEANFLVLDEPTNHLDLWSRQALEQAITHFDGSVLLVTHDRYLVNSVADHVLVMRDGKISQIDGNYDAYRHWLREGLAIEDRGKVSLDGSVPQNQNPSTGGPKGAGSTRPTTRDQPIRRRKFPYRKVHELESEIENLESQIMECNRQLIDPSVLRNGQRVKQVQQSLTEFQQRLNVLYEHYEEACELN